MFQISADQSQWIHLYRVQHVFPPIYIFFACGDGVAEDAPVQVLDLRIVSRDITMTGGSWWVKRQGKTGKLTTRADITKFLELQAKFQIANVTKRGIDDVDMVESSHDELVLAIALDGAFKKNLMAAVPTIFSKLARNLIRELTEDMTDLEFQELADWPTRTEA
jgi:hypothetical protein